MNIYYYKNCVVLSTNNSKGISMTDPELQRIDELLNSPTFIEELRRRQEEDFAKAPKCYCGERCDPPFGDGKKCLVCNSKPTGDDMSIIVY